MNWMYVVWHVCETKTRTHTVLFLHYYMSFSECVCVWDVCVLYICIILYIPLVSNVYAVVCGKGVPSLLVCLNAPFFFLRFFKLTFFLLLFSSNKFKLSENGTEKLSFLTKFWLNPRTFEIQEFDFVWVVKLN